MIKFLFSILQSKKERVFSISINHFIIFVKRGRGKEWKIKHFSAFPRINDEKGKSGDI